MANPGMLPKFRPATLGGRTASARPVIRPVRTPQPSLAPSLHPRIGNGENAISKATFEEPATVTDARQQIHELARQLPSQYSDDVPTQVHPFEGGLIGAWRAPAEDLAVPYRSLPCVEIPRPYDEYEAQFAEHDPTTTPFRAANDSPVATPVARRHVESGERVRDEVFGGPRESYDTYPHEWTSDEDSGPRERAQHEFANHGYHEVSVDFDDESFRREGMASRDQPTRREKSPYHASVAGDHEESSAPPSTRIPAPQVGAHMGEPAPSLEMAVPAGFVMGVQPIRNVGAPVAGPTPFHGQPNAFVAAADAQHAPHRSPMRTPVMAYAYEQSASSAMNHALSSGAHVAPPIAYPVHTLAKQPSSNVGRFACFVFGVAFGIVFAFFATGFVPQLGKKEASSLPEPAEPLPAQQSAMAQQPAPPVTEPSFVIASNSRGLAPPPIAPPVEPPPIVTAPAAHPQSTSPPVTGAHGRANAVARPSAPSTEARPARPAAAPARATASKEKEADIGAGDLLSAGLGP